LTNQAYQAKPLSIYASADVVVSLAMAFGLILWWNLNLNHCS